MTLRDADHRHIWHPFTQHGSEPAPIVVDKARGASLFTPDGHELLDMISSWWTSIHGHAHPALNRALAEQAAAMEHVMFAGFTHPPAIALSERLAAILPGDLDRVFFSDDGSTAVEVAVKLAFQYWKNQGATRRTRFLAFEGAYHGDTLGAMAVGRGSGFYAPFDDLMFAVDLIAWPGTWDRDDEVEAREERALADLRDRLRRDGDSVAAIVVEPLVQGAGGMRMCRPGFLRAAVEMARAFGVLVIFDEVAVGFGRTGTMFACQQVGVVPDFICLSKGLTAGYLPMSVTVTTERIFEAFLDDGPRKMFTHGHSFTANPLACAVALKSLELFDEEASLDRVARIERAHRAQLDRLHASPGVARPRLTGSILAFDLRDDAGGYKSSGSERLRDYFLSRGLNIRPLGDAVYLMPPYCITDEQLSAAYAGIFQGLEDLR
ncbi:MAG: adenosylmethionine--8-amino-7-oxononanoate transaminase [Alphaproteobacteria bacterium]|jgi:adenosylmethionine-8-amino-7-oxononanoate aminotransferase|nr:adenosylmethionine--8-amino-7-oxononanoate transaminase [Alphaproteobacteria bacterium]